MHTDLWTFLSSSLSETMLDTQLTSFLVMLKVQVKDSKGREERKKEIVMAKSKEVL